VTIWIVVVDPAVVHVDAVVAVDCGVDVLVFAAGFLFAGEVRVPSVDVAAVDGFVLAPGRVPVGEAAVVVAGGAEEGPDSAGD
jgi:hypothetical protein